MVKANNNFKEVMEEGSEEEAVKETEEEAIGENEKEAIESGN